MFLKDKEGNLSGMVTYYLILEGHLKILTRKIYSYLLNINVSLGQ